MLGFFNKRPLLASELRQWQFDCVAWLFRHGGGMEPFRKTPLVCPTDEFFPQRGLIGHALAEAIFLQVKEHADMSDWPCRLMAQEDDPDPVLAPTLVVKGAPTSAAGTFSPSEDDVVISYHPAMLNDPMALIAIFAHELAHYWTAGFEEPPPGGWENWEYATDLASVFLGFGIFAANSAFSFTQFTSVDSQGWRSRRQGYLSEPELLHAQAIFSSLAGIGVNEVTGHLKPSLRGMYKRAVAEVSGCTERVSALKSL